MLTSSDLEKALRSQVDGDLLWQHVVRLSALERVSGTDGEREAAEYIMARLEDYGVSADLHRFEAYLSYPLEAEFQVLEPERFSIPCRPSAFASSTPDDGIDAEVVVLASASDRPEKGSNIYAHQEGRASEYEAADFAGKIVLSTSGGPDGVRSAETNGAVAHVHVWPSSENVLHERIVTPIWGTPTLEAIGRLPGIPAISMRRSDGERIRAMCTSGRVRARLRSRTFVGWRTVSLPVATIVGQHEPERFLLAGGHLCSWFYGATDNATGNACLLEMARVLGQNRGGLRRGVRVAWWPGHSQGRYAGSTWYADNFFADLRRNCVAYFNVDSPGIKDAGRWECRLEHGEVEKFVRDTIVGLTGQEPSLRRPNKASDQSFWGIGVPSLAAYHVLPPDHPLRGTVGGSGGGYWWHSPDDTLDKADVGVLAEDTGIYLAFVARLCSGETLPFEFATSAQDFQKRLVELGDASKGHLDLETAVGLARQFEAAAARLDSIRARSSGSIAETLNYGLMRISRIVNPVLYTVAGDYHQDPALQTSLLPGLKEAGRLATLDPEGSDYRFLRTRLLRERNRTEDALRRAVAETERLVRELA